MKVLLLVLLASLELGCSESKQPNSCSNAGSYPKLQSAASAASRTAYVAPEVEPCALLDPPSDGLATSPGLTAAEYSALSPGANGNFFDDGVWWLKATPRGETHVDPLQIVDDHCQKVDFASFDYEYGAAQPALDAAPACGRYLAGIQVGRRVADSWPQVFGLDGSGFARVAALARSSEFGGYLWLPAELPGSGGARSHTSKVVVLGADDISVELWAYSQSPSFESVARLVLSPGTTTQLTVELDIYRRATAEPPLTITVASLAEQFTVDSANPDSLPAFIVHLRDGTRRSTDLAGLDGGRSGWAVLPLTTAPEAVESLALWQAARDAGDQAPPENLQPNLTISGIDSSVPLNVQRFSTGEKVAGGNAVASLVLDLGDAAPDPIHVTYTVSATLR